MPNRWWQYQGLAKFVSDNGLSSADAETLASVSGSIRGKVPVRQEEWAELWRIISDFIQKEADNE